MPARVKELLAHIALLCGGAMLLCVLTGAVSAWLGHPLPPQPALDLVRTATGRTLAKFLAVVLVGAPVCEELVFRGLLFRLPLRLLGAARGRRAAAVALALASSCLFSAIHYLGRAGGRWTFTLDTSCIALVYFGLMQCRAYVRFGSILHPMVAHCAFNLVNLAVVFAL